MHNEFSNVTQLFHHIAVLDKSTQDTVHSQGDTTLVLFTLEHTLSLAGGELPEIRCYFTWGSI